MVIDPMEGHVNARDLRVWELLFPITRFNNHVGMDIEDSITFIT